MTSTDSAQKAPAKNPWDLPDVSGLVVGVLGGTGPQGKGLAYRLAKAGQKVIIGSRAADRARAAPGRPGRPSARGEDGHPSAVTGRRRKVIVSYAPKSPVS